MTGGASHRPADAQQPVSHAGRAMRGMLLAPCPGWWPSVWCVCASLACRRDPGLPQTSRFISMRLYAAGEHVIPGEPPWRGPKSAHMQQTLPNRVGPLPSWCGGCSRCFINRLSPTTFFSFGFISQRGSLHRSAFIIVCGLAPKSFCLCSFAADKAGLLRNASDRPLALVGVSSLVLLSPQDMHEPPWLWLAQQPGQQGPGSCVVIVFLFSSALTLLPAKSHRMWVSRACIHLFECLSSAARLKRTH